MCPKIKSQKQLELEVENFNLKYQPGHKVAIKFDDGCIKEVTVEHPATVICGSSVGWFEEIRGAYSLDRVQ